ncbi:MAG: Pycsar system effector family protein [Acidiferrobacterales bacterium]
MSMLFMDRSLGSERFSTQVLGGMPDHLELWNGHSFLEPQSSALAAARISLTWQSTQRNPTSAFRKSKLSFEPNAATGRAFAMNNESDRLQMAQWILERNLHWIGAAEVKTGVIVALNTAMLGGLATAFSVAKVAEHTAWAIFFSITGAVCLLLALFCAAMSVLPRTDGPPASFVFFGNIAKRNSADYADSFKRADNAAFLQDCLDQIHRNAEIASDKFRWVRNAMMWSFGAVTPWVAAIVCLLKV